MSVPIPVVSDGSVPTVVNLAVRTWHGLATVSIASLGRCESVRYRAVPAVNSQPSETDIVVIGAGPAGSSAAAWAARSGRDVVLIDAAVFPETRHVVMDSLHGPSPSLTDWASASGLDHIRQTKGSASRASARSWKWSGRRQRSRLSAALSPHRARRSDPPMRDRVGCGDDRRHQSRRCRTRR